MMMTAAEAIVAALEREAVSVVFGYPGAAICPLYDALGRSSLRHILVQQEQSGGHAANGYARISGKPGVCLATSGPGATNLITALATAYMDSVPLVAITGQVSTELLGRDVFQEADITGATEPFTKHSYLVKNARDIPRIVKEAFFIANTGRKGPVLIDVPVDVQETRIDFEYPEAVVIRGYKPSEKGNKAQLGRVLEALRGASRPVMCVGGGVFGAGAVQEVRALAQCCAMPVVSTLMGLGVMPSAHPLFFGMLGTHGCATANRALGESDLLIIVGARAGDRAMTNPGVLQRRTRIVHIDIDPAEIGKVMEAKIPLVGDARQVLRQLLEQEPKLETAAWLDELRAWKREETHPNFTPRAGCVGAVRLTRLLSGQMRDDAVYVADVGQNQIWSARGVQLRTGRFLTSGGMGTMGYALPAAIGAALAQPNGQVVAVCGDGGFQMALPELATLVRHSIPVKIVVLRNGILGMIREIQERQYGGSFVSIRLDGTPDLCKLAAAYGIGSRALRCWDEAEDAVRELLAAEGPFLLDCSVDPTENAV